MQAIIVLQLNSQICDKCMIPIMNAYIATHKHHWERGWGPRRHIPFPSQLSLIIIAELLQTSCIVVSSSCTPALWSRRGHLELATTILLLCE